MPVSGMECYKGELMITKNTTKEEKEKEPVLEVCGDNEVCISKYVRTDVKIEGKKTIPAGSWMKKCIGKKSDMVTEHFGEDISDECKDESEKHVEVCTINA